jgi:hypothetical protein
MPGSRRVCRLFLRRTFLRLAFGLEQFREETHATSRPASHAIAMQARDSISVRRENCTRFGSVRAASTRSGQQKDRASVRERGSQTQTIPHQF